MDNIVHALYTVLAFEEQFPIGVHHKYIIYIYVISLSYWFNLDHGWIWMTSEYGLERKDHVRQLL